jgi:hypothetical protein
VNALEKRNVPLHDGNAKYLATAKLKHMYSAARPRHNALSLVHWEHAVSEGRAPLQHAVFD